MDRLENAVVLITGAGRGLGAALCETLSEAGATIVAADVREDLTAQLARKFNDRGSTLTLDVGDEHAVREAITTVIDRHQRLDVLINNAGTDVTLPIDELTVADWDRVLTTNLRGPFLLTKAVVPLMKQQGGGQIINIASTAAKRAWPNASAYHSSKWGVLGLSHALHAELRPHKIKVTAVVCGGMRTPFLLDRFPDIDPEVLQDPANVARTIRFLLTLPPETVVPEITVLPMRETSWP